MAWLNTRPDLKKELLIRIVHDRFDIVSGKQASHSVAHSFIPAVVVLLYNINDCALHEWQLIILVLCVIVYGNNWKLETDQTNESGISQSRHSVASGGGRLLPLLFEWFQKSILQINLVFKLQLLCTVGEATAEGYKAYILQAEGCQEQPWTFCVKVLKGPQEAAGKELYQKLCTELKQVVNWLDLLISSRQFYIFPIFISMKHENYPHLAMA